MVGIVTRKIGLYLIATALIVSGVTAERTACAQGAKKSSGKTAAKAAEPRHRLPAYYAKVVDDAQKENIYAIQDKHAAKIDALQAELKAAMDKRDAEIEDVLTPKQKADVKALAAEAKAKRAAGKSGDKSADAKADDGGDKPAAKATIRAPRKTATKKSG